MALAQNLFFLITYLALPVVAFLTFLLIYKKNKKEYFLKSDLEDLQGRINITYQQLEAQELKSKAFRFKLKRYDALAILTERLNQKLSLDDTFKMLLDESYALLGQEKNVCLAYLVDRASGNLSLRGVKGDPSDNLIIKEKRGDLFDEWLIKHMQPLLVEDVSSDFRFDPEKLKNIDGRKIGSLIASCLISQDRPIGVVRFDSPHKNLFNLEDLRLLSAIADIASVAIDNAQYYERIRELAIRDSLTGLYTRKFILERLDEELKRSLVSESELSIMMIDIDSFKKYNDQYGHLAGDIVLRNLSAWINECLNGQTSVAGRLGGEEFLVILPQCAKQEAFSLAENMRGIIQEKVINLRRKATTVTISIGISAFTQDARQKDDLLNKADIALYEAKRMGRNRVCLF